MILLVPKYSLVRVCSGALGTLEAARALMGFSEVSRHSKKKKQRKKKGDVQLRLIVLTAHGSSKINVVQPVQPAEH